MDFFTLYALFSMIFTTISLVIKFFKLLKNIKAGELKKFRYALPVEISKARIERQKLRDEEIQRIMAEREQGGSDV